MSRRRVIPADLEDLLIRPLVASCATVGPRGGPQCSPLWFLWEEETLHISLVGAQQKCRNLRRLPEAALTILDSDNEARYIEIRCTVEEFRPDPGLNLVTRLAKRYGVPDFDPPAGEHLAVRLAPHRISRLL